MLQYPDAIILITKSDFVRYLDCPLYAWLWKNKPELRDGHRNSRIADQGEEVEKLAHQLLSGGKEVEENYKEAEKHTHELMSGGAQIIYQATALTDHYLARADILKRDTDGKRWHIFEVKSSTKKKPEHIPDLCFQLNAFRQAGFEIASVNLVLVNSDYVYQEAIGLELDKFFKIEDLTEEIFSKVDGYKLEMQEAYKVLTNDIEPKVLSLKKNFKYPLPEKFSEYYWKDVPDFSIYDISNIRKNKLELLRGRNILKIQDIPEDFELSDSQNIQVQLTKKEANFVDGKNIKEELEKLEYPLYFLDYETINPAIPFLDQTRPHQQIPFQYSLHILEAPGSELQHRDFLHMEKTTPIPHLLKALRADIGDTGSVIVWNKPFERGCNEGMGESCNEYKDFMDSVNNRLYDLMLIFKDKYLDYRFKGSASIKNVLPVLVPELNYKELEIQHGSMAMDGIVNLIERITDNVKKLADALRVYCKLDTLAMVRIFEVIRKL